MTTKTSAKRRARALQKETGWAYLQCMRCVQCNLCSTLPNENGPGCECMHAPCIHDFNRRRLWNIERMR
jgi:hypothetical protein